MEKPIQFHPSSLSATPRFVLLAPQLTTHQRLTEVGVILSSAILRLKAKEIASNNLEISNSNAFLGNNSTFPLDSLPLQSVHRDSFRDSLEIN